MRGAAEDKPVLFIVGPTASGKTAFALQVAQEHNAEIICADSRTVYRGMDLGTAKPTAEEQHLVRHHLLDVVNPDEPFSVADFKQLATQAIQLIQSRHKLPLVVGGSGLYIDALLYNFSLRPVASANVQEKLRHLSDNQLRDLLDNQRIELNPSDRFNRRRLERVASVGLRAPEPRLVPANYQIIGLNPGIEVIEQRIAERTRQWFDTTILEETDVLVTTFGRIEPLNTPPYREIADWQAEGGTMPEVQGLINLHLRQLAKRQLTWLKRNPHIAWAVSAADAAQLVSAV